MTRTLVVSIHDVAPSTLDEVARLRDLVRRHAGEVPVSLLAVPRYHGNAWDDAAVDWLRERCRDGDEPVVHGLVHFDSRRRDGAEFGRRDSVGDTIARLAFATAEVRAMGVHPRGFVAPAYAHPPVLERALLTSGLEWWATRMHLRTPSGSVDLPSIGLGASTGARRVSSSVVAPLAARAMAHIGRVRLDLHPADLRHRRLAQRIGPLLDDLLAQGRTVTTHAALVRRDLTARRARTPRSARTAS